MFRFVNWVLMTERECNKEVKKNRAIFIGFCTRFLKKLSNTSSWKLHLRNSRKIVLFFISSLLYCVFFSKYCSLWLKDFIVKFFRQKRMFRKISCKSRTIYFIREIIAKFRNRRNRGKVTRWNANWQPKKFCTNTRPV